MFLSMKELVVTSLFVVVVVVGLWWMFQGNDFFLYKVFAPKYEAVRRETFEQSKAYRHGMIQELRKQQVEYVRAKEDSPEREALASLILQQVAELDEDAMPKDLQEFVTNLRHERMGSYNR